MKNWNAESPPRELWVPLSLRGSFALIIRDKSCLSLNETHSEEYVLFMESSQKVLICSCLLREAVIESHHNKTMGTSPAFFSISHLQRNTSSELELAPALDKSLWKQSPNACQTIGLIASERARTPERTTWKYNCSPSLPFIMQLIAWGLLFHYFFCCSLNED